MQNQEGWITLGVVLPLSGGDALFGSQGLQGIEMAVAEINREGGVLNGRKFRLVIEDEKTNLFTAVKKTEKVIAHDGAIAVIGPTSSASRNAMLEVVTKYRTPLLYGTDYEGGCCSRYLFCYSPIPDHCVKPFIPYLLENHGSSFYLIGADYIWPRKMNEAIRAEVEKHKGIVVEEEYCPFNIRDFSPQLRKVSDTGVEIIIVMLLGSDTLTFIRQFKKFGLSPRRKLAIMGFNENFLPYLDSEEAEGIITCVPFLATLNLPETKEFVNRQKKMFGPNTIVSYYVESHYGLVMFLKNAIQKAGTTDKEQIIDSMGDQTLIFGNGSVTLRSLDHHMILNMVIGEVSNGMLVPKKYFGPIVPQDQCCGRGLNQRSNN